MCVMFLMIRLLMLCDCQIGWILYMWFICGYWSVGMFEAIEVLFCFVHGVVGLLKEAVDVNTFLEVFYLIL